MIVCPACGGKALVPGRLGGFLLHARIGEGEMGTVYRATDETLNREVAVKLVSRCDVDNPQSRERLLREACAAGKVNHPRIAQVYALNFSNGYPYLVMELVTGEDFARKLARDGALDEETVLRMALDVADGLSALNREGLVHGDIKPGNIVIDRDGNAKLVDFGLSGMTRFDGAGTLVGTPDYIAPELLRGAADTHRSDLYSLGATLYHLLSGHLPHEGETPSDFLKAKTFLPPTPLKKYVPGVSPLTQKMVMRMLAHDPEDRQADSDAVLREIRRALDCLNLRRALSQPGAPSALRRFFTRLGKSVPVQILSRLRLPHLSAVFLRRTALSAVVCVFVAAIVYLFLANDRLSATATAWFRREVANRFLPPPKKKKVPARVWRDITPVAAAAVLPVPLPVHQTAAEGVPPQPFTTETDSTWQSTNLGGQTSRGSTMQKGGLLIIQGTGTDMWKGYDNCRFVWTPVYGDYAFSAQIQMTANTHPSATSGLLVRGRLPTTGAGLFFGVLGTGELVLQVRRPAVHTEPARRFGLSIQAPPDNDTELICRSGNTVPIPCHIQLVRHENLFTAKVSSNGRDWTPFASCKLPLPERNTVGFSVSSQLPDTLATAKFANIHLMTPDPAASRHTGSASKY